MKICLTTYFDRNFSEMGKLCLKSMRKYAKKHNIDIKLHNNIKSKRPPAWNKILVIQKLLDDPKKYDFIFWIDSDALFVRFDEDIRKEIERAKEFYMVKHSYDNNEAPNTGVMLIKNSRWCREFLQKVWDNSRYIYSIGWENAALCNIMGYKAKQNKLRELFQKVLYKLKIKNLVSKILKKVRISHSIARSFELLNFNRENAEDNPNSEMLNKIKWLDYKWNSLPYYLPTTNSIINHYPSINYSQRLKRMKEDLTKALA